MAKDSVFPDSNQLNSSGVIGLASPKDRLAAAVLDCILILPIVQILQSPVRRALFEALLQEESELAGSLRVYNLLIFVLFFIFYYSLATYWKGQTLGKMFFQIKVISYQGRLSLLQCFSRSLGMVLSFVTLGIPFIALFAHSLRRPFHDRVADTLVIGLKNPVGFPEARERLRARYVGAFLSVVALFLTGGLFVEEDVAMLAATELLGEKNCEKQSLKVDSNIESLIALRLDQKISSQCLKKKAREQLWTEGQEVQAQFAMSLSFDGDGEKSLQYLEGVCNSQSHHSLCKVSQWIRASLSEKSFNSLDLYHQIKGESDSPTAKLLLGRFLLEEGHYPELLELMQNMKSSAVVEPLHASLSFHALLGNLKWDEAKWVFQTHDYIDHEDLILFVFWNMEDKKFSIRQKMDLVELFYPEVQNLGRVGRAPASEENQINEQIVEVYDYLEGQL